MDRHEFGAPYTTHRSRAAVEARNDGARTERRSLAYPELENPMKCHEYYERGRMLIPTQLYLTHGYYFTMNGGMLWDKNREEWGRHT